MAQVGETVTIEMPESGTVYTATSCITNDGKLEYAVVTLFTRGNVDQTVTPPQKPQPQPSNDVASFLRVLHEPGSVFEIRALDCPERPGSTYKKTFCGYFDDVDKAAAVVADLESRKPLGIYVTLNPVHSDLLARCCNRVDVGKSTTADSDVTRRRWLFIDVDPKRPSGISASDEERETGRVKAQQIIDDLASRGWPAPLVCSSGNGWHLLYRIDLPNNDKTKDLIERTLKGLAEKYSTPQVHIDNTVFNASRITRCYGTTARKGDSIPGRPHRQSFGWLPPEPLGVVPEMMLEMVAVPEAPPAPPKTPYKGTQAQFDLDYWLRQYSVPVTAPEQYKGGRKWHFTERPPFCACDWKPKDAYIIQGSDGAISAKCSHSRCTWEWRNLRQHYEPGCYDRKEPQNNSTQQQQHEHKQVAESKQDEKPLPPLPMIRSIKTLAAENPKLREVVVDGLLRVGETCNFIAASKAGKTFLAVGLALSVALGRKWLGRQTTQGRVLIIDNELHGETLAHRLRTVADAMETTVDELEGTVDTLSLRGHLLSLPNMGRVFDGIQAGTYRLIVLDALYRMLPDGTSESDNAQMTALYNMLDAYASQLNASFVVVHHSSKGEQGGKNVTDVGSGAGAISRAADAHLTVRPHEQDGFSVLEGRVRSFQSPEPQTVQFSWPLWTAVEEVEAVVRDPAAKQRQAREEARNTQKQHSDRQDVDKLLSHIPSKGILQTELRGLCGWGNSKFDRIFGLAQTQWKVVDVKKRRKKDGKKQYIRVFRKYLTVAAYLENQPPIEIWDSSFSK